MAKKALSEHLDSLKMISRKIRLSDRKILKFQHCAFKIQHHKSEIED